jgi:4-nitrophenyl phosphatase
MVARDGYVERLAAMGIETTAEEIVTSSSATVEHLHRHAPDVRRVMAIGAEGLREELTEAGFQTTMAGDVTAAVPGGALPESYDALIVGLDPSFDYARLASGMSAVAAGARLIATNADARYPTPTGFLPGAGSIVASLAAATGVMPEVIGKPEPAMFRAIIEASGVPAAQTVVVGDNPASDIMGARRAGCASILVLTGVADAGGASMLIDDAAPHAVADDPAAVRALLEPLVS